MKYAITFKPTDEYVSFYDNGKAILFTEDEVKIHDALNDILFADGGVDDNVDDFSISIVDYDTDGSEFVTEDEMFVSKALIK